MLGITDATITSPPSSAQIVQYRPAVSFKNSGDVLAYITGTLLIRNVAADRVEYSGQIIGEPIAPGATGIAQCSELWTPTAGQSYSVEASIFTGNADASASATAPPLTVTTPGATTTITSVYVQIPTGATAMVIQFNKPISPDLELDLLPFGRIMDPKDWPPND
jgi:hypothetical protein